MPDELHPHLLYCVDGGQARFATWRLNEGHESLAIFTTSDVAEKYRAGLSDCARWTAFEPTRDKLLDILRASLAAGILYAALDPTDGHAKTLFDIPRVLAAGAALESEP